jgi:3-hydroxymyristoyl/3-hydroxydecanoyl-(acyl carrier protein) dehydratase
LQADGTSSFELNFAADDPTFAGHFPGHPLLPGVFQLEMARIAAEWMEGCKYSVNEIVKSKFQRPILPGETVKLNVKLSEIEGVISVRANFLCGGQSAGETFLKLRRCD